MNFCFLIWCHDPNYKRITIIIKHLKWCAISISFTNIKQITILNMFIRQIYVKLNNIVITS